MSNEPREESSDIGMLRILPRTPWSPQDWPSVEQYKNSKMFNFKKFITMKQIENNFQVTGFVGKDADIRSFENSAVARFSLAVSHGQKTGEETTYTSAFLQTEIWRKSADCKTFELLKKGTHLTIEGYFKPEEWTDAETGAKRHHLILVATKAYEVKEKPEATEAQE